MLKQGRWVLALKVVLSALLCSVALYLLIAIPNWSGQENLLNGVIALCLISASLTLLHNALIQRVGLLAFFALLVALVVDVPGRAWVAGLFALYALLLIFFMWLLHRPTANRLINLGVLLATLCVLFIVMELAAPNLTQAIAAAQREAAIQAAAAEANPPLDQSALQGRSVQNVPSGSPQAEFIERGPGPWWGEVTGWGTSTDTTLRYWLDGVYDNVLTFNSKGFRGPDIPYDKPDDVFRVLLVGDSFIEAREVAYEHTVYAQLQNLLADARTPDGRRIEVFGVGATGWGTLQAYLYYLHEGQRFAPDLIVHFFVVNDVSDNHPTAFYPDRDLDFALSADAVQVVNGAAQTQAAYNPTERFLDALPQTNTTQLLRQVLAPPRQAVTLTGDFARLHPQTYIFVRTPEIEGYATAWARTEQAYRLWSQAAQANGAQLMVLAVDFTVERITELATYFAGQQDGWIWDVDLPTQRLQNILGPLDVPLIDTRAAYEAYAEPLAMRPYDALYYVQDGHWNPQGHALTAQVLADALREQGLVSASANDAD